MAAIVMKNPQSCITQMKQWGSWIQREYYTKNDENYSTDKTKNIEIEKMISAINVTLNMKYYYLGMWPSLTFEFTIDDFTENKNKTVEDIFENFANQIIAKTNSQLKEKISLNDLFSCPIPSGEPSMIEPLAPNNINLQMKAVHKNPGNPTFFMNTYSILIAEFGTD